MTNDDHSGSLRRTWPTGTDYSRAVQTPGASFSDAALAGGRPGVNALGMPLVASGQNAVVFLVETEQGRQAVRCFLTPPHEGAIRYAALEHHLQDTAPRALTAARWLPDGVAVDGARWPVVVMPWVEGSPLNIAVEDMLDEPERVRALAVQWSEVVRSLQRARVAHGDLQHGNVLVRSNGSIALVDLDGVWVPEIAVGPPAEYGHPNYQHPARTSQHWGQYVDSFPGALIEMALYALVADPSLTRFLNGENLLFTRADLERPSQSAAWDAVVASPDPKVAALATVLRERCGGPISEVLVPFDDLRSGAQLAPAAESGVDVTVLRSSVPSSTFPPPVLADSAAPPVTAVEETPWWQQSGDAATAPAHAAPPPVAAASVPAGGSTTSPLVWLGRNLMVAGVIGGIIAGVLGCELTILFDAALNERQETAAFVVLIGVMLGGLLQSMQAFASGAWTAALRRFCIGAFVGGVSGVAGIPVADALVKAVSSKALSSTAVSSEEGVVQVVTHVPFIANVLMFMVVASFLALALGLLRSIRTALWAGLAGVVGGAAGGAIFGQTVASWNGSALDVKYLEPATLGTVGVVCAAIGMSYGAAVRLRSSATLTVIEGPNSGLEIAVEGERATIGSSNSSNLVMKQSTGVLPTHAVVWLETTPPEVEAVGLVVRNGTPVAGRQPLADGDVLMIAGSFIRLDLKEAQ